eukprot:7610072-Prorocentrum_lima.AAC.1
MRKERLQNHSGTRNSPALQGEAYHHTTTAHHTGTGTNITFYHPKPDEADGTRLVDLSLIHI